MVVQNLQEEFCYLPALVQHLFTLDGELEKLRIIT